MAIITFLIASAVVIFAGTKLAIYGDVLAKKTRLGHGLVGVVLIAGATSLPELASSISAALIQAPDIAFGNVYGSNAFNLMILAIADLLQGKGSLLQIVRANHILSAMIGIMMTGFSVLAIWMGPSGFLEITVGWLSSYSIFLIMMYLFSAFLLIRYEGKATTDHTLSFPEVHSTIDQSQLQGADDSRLIQKTILRFSIAALMIIAAGYALSVSSASIAADTGLGQTFIGTLLVAAATSLPELVATIAAIRIGAYNMAVGNVFGSNVFNILILALSDMFYLQGSVFAVVSTEHLLTAVTTMILSSIAVIGLFYRSKRTILMVGWDCVAIMIGYLTMAYALFKLSIHP